MGIKIITNNKIWMEQDAIHQLKKISEYEGVTDIAGLPDLHSGKMPIGATFKTIDIIYPLIIGNDVGCGISLFNTGVKLKKINIPSVIKRLEGTSIYGKYTIGGGNHFIEMQTIEKIYNKDYAKQLDLDRNKVYLMIHSGSRAFGEKIYKQYGSPKGYKTNTKEFREYLKAHEEGVEIAKENRIQLADIFMDMLNYKYDNKMIVDCFHNYLEINDDGFYHHKGSVSTLENEFALIAGSRGSYSYIVRCIPKEETLFSISHGAGRKWARGMCKGKLERKYKRDELKQSKLGSVVITNDKALLYEEATEAYKNIEEVISILEDYGVIEVIARMKPEVTYKC